jgi:hypothetical protein
MCDYSLHAQATRPAQVGETLITTTFCGTSTRGFASANEPEVAVCLLPGTELAFDKNVRYDGGFLSIGRTIKSQVGKFGYLNVEQPHQHHDAIEFPDGSSVLVTDLAVGQQVTVLQLPAGPVTLEEHAHKVVEASRQQAPSRTPSRAPA